jgi:hypothetical protein
MKTTQCGVCVFYRKDLKCEAFPDGIPESILTGQVDHSKPYEGDGGKRFTPKPGVTLAKSDADAADAVNAIVARDDVAYRRVKTVLQRKGYEASDFDEGGPLYGYSTNELIKLAREADDAAD